MGSNTSILDIGPWASVLGPVFTQALNPDTPPKAHRELAEQATEYLEQGALLGDNAPDAEVPWRALRGEEMLFVALENGFALAQFDGANLVKLRVENFDGRRWSVLHTGRGLAAFRSAALGGGTEPVLKIALLHQQQVVFGQVIQPNGFETPDQDLHRAQANPTTDVSGHGLAPGSGFGWDFGPTLVGTGAVLMRKALAYRSRMAELPVPLGARPEPPFPPRPEPSPEPVLAPVFPTFQAAAPAPSWPLPIVPEVVPEVVKPMEPVAAPPRRQTSAWGIVGMSGPMEGKTFTVLELSVLGRDPNVEISLSDQTASRRHAELRPTEIGLVLRDLESSNGTWIGEFCLEGPVLLKSGDVFSLGDCSFRVERNALEV